MHTGETLRLLRLIKGHKQQYVARCLGITQQAYSKLEKQIVILEEEKVKKILLALNCKKEDLESLATLTSADKQS